MSQENQPVETYCMACSDKSCNFKPVKFFRRPVGDEDIQIEMKYCGVCHTDLHSAAGHLENVAGKVEYPHVPGHELSGVITRIGKSVTGFKVGDQVGVGCMVDSCLSCKQCLAGNEHKCSRGQTGTYQGVNKHGRAESYPPGRKTLGGYTSVMVVHYKFCVLIPPSYPLEMAGPVMCAGVTMFSPLVNYGVKAGTKVGIVGLGGLGQMGIRIAKAMGAIVTVISRSETKKELALNCGASNFVISTNDEDMKKCEKLDLIINTIPAYHNYVLYQQLLTNKGIQVIVGVHTGFVAALLLNGITFGNSRIKVSVIGSIKETQDVINFCDQHKIFPDIKIVPVTEINEVYTNLDKSNEAGIRYVLDIANTLNKDTVYDAPAPTIQPNDGFTIGGAIVEMMGLFVYGRWW